MAKTYKLEARMVNLNLRVEKAGKKPGEKAADLRFETVVKADRLSDVPGCGDSHAMLATFYADDGSLKRLGVSGYDIETETLLATVKVGGCLEDATSEEFRRVTIGNIHVEPKSDRAVMITFRLQVHPTKEQAAELFDALQQMQVVEMELAQGTLALNDAAGEASATAATKVTRQRRKPAEAPANPFH